MRGIAQVDEELRAVGAGTAVGHRQHATQRFVRRWQGGVIDVAELLVEVLKTQ